jgi:hypothetical protein
MCVLWTAGAATPDADHIVAGRVVWPTVEAHGILLSKIDHAALDTHLIGIDADFRLQI